MMVANSSNLIVTVKPANQRTLAPRRPSFSQNSQRSSGSQQSQHTNPASDENDPDDQEDEVIDLIAHQNLDENSLINQKDGVLHL